MKPFLVMQLRPETEASDDEFRAILTRAGLAEHETTRIRLDIGELSPSLALDDHSGVIVGGGPGCVSDAEAEKTELDRRMESAVRSLMPQIVARDFPFLGCCYGIGILGHHLCPGIVSKERYGEPVGAVSCTLTREGRTDPLLGGVADGFRALVGHKEALQALPPACTHLVESEPAPFQMIRYGSNVYATQFHPEADISVFETRIRIYRNFGYFPPEEARSLINALQGEVIDMPGKILANFVKRYQRS